MTLNRQLLFLHFGLLALLIANGIFLSTYGMGLNMMLTALLKMLFFFSGAILFFRYRKPFKKRALYFGIYVFYPLLMILGYMLDGIFGVILFSIFFAVFWMPGQEAKNSDHVIVKPFNGFLNNYARYEIKQNKYFLFQKHRAEFKADPEFRPNASKFSVRGDTAFVTLTGGPYGAAPSDTTLVISLQ